MPMTAAMPNRHGGLLHIGAWQDYVQDLIDQREARLLATTMPTQLGRKTSPDEILSETRIVADAVS